MTIDIISYYQEHHELPPIGTKNDLGEDIGAFYSDFEHSNFDSTMIKYFQMYQLNILCLYVRLLLMVDEIHLKQLECLSHMIRNYF